MGKRHLSRQLALQVLYAADTTRDSFSSIVSSLAETGLSPGGSWTQFCIDLVERTEREQQDLDQAIAGALENWRIERLSKVDRIILRLALCEMRHFSDIPLRVTLNEYIELAKQFGTDESASFVNGILDQLSNDFSDKDFNQRNGAPGSD